MNGWRHLESRVADYFARNGYTARTNQWLRGETGSMHEIDASSTTTTAQRRSRHRRWTHRSQDDGRRVLASLSCPAGFN